MDEFASKQTTRAKRLVTTGLLLLLLALVIVGAIGYQAYSIYQSDLPSFEQLHNIEPSLNTKVYDRNGVLLKEFYSENRLLTPYKDMPPYLIQMLLASEDREFFNHWGINLRRLAIVMVENTISFDRAAGASTITQQLSRMLFLNRERTLNRKIKEALTAVKLERTYSKEEILEMYLNQYYFGRGSYGIASAARTFFSKQPKDLTINDCAVLIGTLKAPNINSPFLSPEKSLAARNRVLYSLYDVGGISHEKYDSLKALPLTINPPQQDDGVAPYFTETIRQYVLDRYGEDALYSGGLKVFTGLDAGLQAVAEKAIIKKIDSLRKAIDRKYDPAHKDYGRILPDTADEYGQPVRELKLVQGAFVAIDNATGDVLAMVGGRSFDETKFNRAVQGLRQPGSAFKPFVYTAAIDNGFRASDIIDDNPIVLDIPGSKEWKPHNYDFEFLGPITLRDGLRLSRNLVAIRLLLKMTPSQVIFYAKKFGITTPMQEVPSLAIGVSDVRPMELVSAYTVFPNGGVRVPYRMIQKIVDRYGSVLENNTTVQKEEVLSEKTAFIMVDIMKSVVDNGTAAGARRMGFNRPAAGKTGTSDNFCDNWFVGYTPQITAGVWIGFDDKTSLGRSQDGGTNAVPIWAEFMMAAHDSLPYLDFPEPAGIIHAYICTETGELATDRCPIVRSEVFTEETQPTGLCSKHASKRLYNPGTDSRSDTTNSSNKPRMRF